MKLNNVQTPRFQKGGYAIAVTLSLYLLYCFSTVRVGAQLRAQKRITSVWTATGAEGSRVTVASDAQLNDYEAYTRGDRFYVKIPLANLPSTTGSLLGRGFDDVHIQRVGDGILLSFRLHPGTTARVDQKLNRIEVVFSIPVRSRNASSVARGEVASRTRARTIGDTIGPAPPTSAKENQTVLESSGRHAERGARVTGSMRRSDSSLASTPHQRAVTRSANESNGQESLRAKAVASSLPKASSTAAAKQPRPSESPTPGKSSESKGSTANGSLPSASPLPSSSPIYSPSPVGSPSSYLAAASPSGAPHYAAPATQRPSASASPSPASTSAGTSDWSSRLHYVKTWVQYNPWPLLIGGLIFVALLLLLFVRGGRKRRNGYTANRALKPEAPAAGRGATTRVGTNPRPVMSDPPAAAAGQNKVQVPSENAVSWPPVGKDVSASEDPEREVFEL